MNRCTYCGHDERQHSFDGPDGFGITDYFCYDCHPSGEFDRMHVFNVAPEPDDE